MKINPNYYSKHNSQTYMTSIIQKINSCKLISRIVTCTLYEYEYKQRQQPQQNRGLDGLNPAGQGP